MASSLLSSSSGWRAAALCVLAWCLCFSPLPSAARVSPRLSAPLCSTSARVYPAGSDAAAWNVQLDAWGNDSIRIRIAPDDIQQIPEVQALLPFPPGLTPPLQEQSSPHSPCAIDRKLRTRLIAADLSNGNIAVSVGTDGQLTVKRVSDGATLVQTTALEFNPVSFESVYTSNYSLYALSLSYTHMQGKVFGLGEHKTNRTAYDDYSHLFENSQVYGVSSGGDISIPFYISTAGFGLLYNQAGYGSIAHHADDNATMDDPTQLISSTCGSPSPCGQQCS